jgi:hypothetical protein
VTLYERVERVSEVDMTKSTRRRLLGRAAKACVGVAAVAAGLAAKAEAAKTVAGCCVLAYQNECPNCTGRGYDCGSGCTRWAWYCVDSSRRVWQCGECYSGSSCSGCSCGHISITQSGNRNNNPIPGGIGPR